jgi:hypothetical protein
MPRYRLFHRARRIWSGNRDPLLRHRSFALELLGAWVDLFLGTRNVYFLLKPWNIDNALSRGTRDGIVFLLLAILLLLTAWRETMDNLTNDVATVLLSRWSITVRFTTNIHNWPFRLRWRIRKRRLIMSKHRSILRILAQSRPLLLLTWDMLMQDMDRRVSPIHHCMVCYPTNWHEPHARWQLIPWHVDGGLIGKGTLGQNTRTRNGEDVGGIRQDTVVIFRT